MVMHAPPQALLECHQISPRSYGIPIVKIYPQEEGSLKKLVIK
jgi:hypothetical protein